MSVLLETLSALSLAGGSLIVVVAGVGIIRLPDFFSRLHGAGLGDTLGAGLVLLGLGLQSGLSLVTLKLLLIVLFLLYTSPTATHVLAKAALHGGHRPLLSRVPRAAPWKRDG